MAADRHLGPADQRAERRERVEPELAGADRQRLGRVRAVAADVDRQAVEAGRVQEQRVRQGPVARRFPAMDEGHPGPAAPPRAGMNQAGSSRSPERTRASSNGSPRSAGVDGRRVLPRIPGPCAVGEREPVGQAELGGGDGRREPGAPDGSHGARGRHEPPSCQARPTGRAPAGATVPQYTAGVAKRDPHVVLGVERGADPTRIKAAWRRLARSNHPDLTGDDPAASRPRPGGWPRSTTRTRR